jgi:hypothetical protein
LLEFGFWRLSGGDEPTLKSISAALALSCIVTFVWVFLDFRPTECTEWLDGECIRVELVGTQR